MRSKPSSIIYWAGTFFSISHARARFETKLFRMVRSLNTPWSVLLVSNNLKWNIYPSVKRHCQWKST
uniref:Putative secreted protein n=1 Tax=Anopheles triannulatus TaxID=58253 RepID=A0A2M4B3H0_9DIPT